MSGTGENGATMTDGDWRIGDWSNARMLAPVGMGAWNWLSADRSAVEGAVAVAGETGVGEA